MQKYRAGGIARHGYLIAITHSPCSSISIGRPSVAFTKVVISLAAPTRKNEEGLR